MAPIIIPSIISAFIVIIFFGIVFGFLFWALRKLNKGITNRRLRRKLAASAMTSNRE
jgi:cbb3-type cytochrome oxidase subunit 3